MRRTAARFAKDEDGAILVMVAVSLGVILGMIALSYDLGRIAATQSELQSYADHVALAAAGELDGEAGARARAQAAAANFFTDRQTFGDDATGQTLNSADYALTFLRSLPAVDTDAITSTHAATTDQNAIYARVIVTPKTVPFTFGRAFFALSGFAQRTPIVGAEAVAGFTSYACDITPMMFCVPPGFDGDTWRGQQILMRSGGNGAAWGPGDFGFLEPSTLAIDSTGACAGLTGAGPLLRCVLGAVGSVTQCFVQRGVNTEPGQKVGITNAMNARFDIYQGSMDRNDPLYAPAPNVIKGIVRRGGGGGGNQCIGANSDPSPNTMKLPRDTCFYTDSCNLGSPNRYGDGDWWGDVSLDLDGDGTAETVTGYDAYLAMNYGATPPSELIGLGSTPTRYQVYNAEIAYAQRTRGNILTGRAETGLNQCAPVASPDPERRVIIAAGINCDPLNGGVEVNGRETNVPVQEYVKMFITETIGDDSASPPTVDIWAEVIESAGGNGKSGSGVFHEIVQLYR
ncbi:pilus assembly protein TadG-related protein [Albidovulum sediminis]|uniref:Pilus assembly protein TadG-related protein n=1 Tax=Albidovulum sediminis TaxID=3066345 RepID=A0ABT2NQQ5_9RHOB|nr:pilus assembly protein TadG-related protein [Defluviimonas sediminis]MCT8329914.1 pilus assembly protein TadG-related protein [Defluviimonas sediminis]